MSVKKINAAGVMKLDAFSHAVKAGDFIYVSGTLGTVGKTMDLAPGGTAGQTNQALENIAMILSTCGATMRDVVKMNVFLADIDTFADMNTAYVAKMGEAPPARITVGKASLGLGAAVEIDCVAYKPAT